MNARWTSAFSKHLSGIFVATRASASHSGLEVRLRITRAISGSIDGIQLDHFETGQLYDVGTATGSYLLAIGAAEPVMEEGPTLIIPSVRWEAKDRRIPLTRPKKPST